MRNKGLVFVIRDTFQADLELLFFSATDLSLWTIFFCAEPWTVLRVLQFLWWLMLAFEAWRTFRCFHNLLACVVVWHRGLSPLQQGNTQKISKSVFSNRTTLIKKDVLSHLLCIFYLLSECQQSALFQILHLFFCFFFATAMKLSCIHAYIALLISLVL